MAKNLSAKAKGHNENQATVKILSARAIRKIIAVDAIIKILFAKAIIKIPSVKATINLIFFMSQ